MLAHKCIHKMHLESFNDVENVDNLLENVYLFNDSLFQ
jgi:hypothetical protein